MATSRGRASEKCVPFRESGHINCHSIPTKETSWFGWCMLVEPELRRWRQEDHDEVHRHACRQADVMTSCWDQKQLYNTKTIIFQLHTWLFSVLSSCENYWGQSVNPNVSPKQNSHEEFMVSLSSCSFTHSHVYINPNR